MNEKYTMSITLNVLNHLGINLYSNIPAVLSEIVANSWDADATCVDVNIDTAKRTITITDNGSGMTEEEVNAHYLSVGYAKRENNNSLSPVYNRRYMGRKGIGKLSMFSVARTIDVITRKNGIVSSFRMDVDDITQAITDDNNNYHPQDLQAEDDGSLPESGTKIILTNLKRNISTATPAFIKKRIARRFSIIGPENTFFVKVNGEEITIEDRDYFSKLEYIWYFGEDSQSYADLSTQATKKVKRDNEITIEGKTYHVYGWLGTTMNSGALKEGDENLNKIVIIVRGKVGQEDILSDFSEGGLYSKYLIGEIHADFFDDDDFDDMATSSRQEYKQDDPRYIALRNFIQVELKQIQHDWTEFKNESGVDKAKAINPIIGEWYDSLQPDDKKAAKSLLGKVNQIVVDDGKRAEVLRYGLLAFEKMRYTQQLHLLDTLDANNLEALGSIITGFDDLEATLYYQIVKSRIEIIKYFQTLVDENDKEKAIQRHLFDHLWLLDPAWERADKSEFMESRIIKAFGLDSDRLTKDERAGRLDIGYRETAGKHVLIELKRAGRVVTTPEIIEQVMKYQSALEKVLRDAGETPVYEIIIVLGKPLDNDNSPEHRTVSADMLKPINSRIVYYDELINHAYRAYNEFVEKSKETQRLVTVLEKLADEGS